MVRGTVDQSFVSFLRFITAIRDVRFDTVHNALCNGQSSFDDPRL